MTSESLTLLKRLLVVIVITFGLMVLLTSLLTFAQTTPEREVEDKIPKHVPIKVKIRSEKEKAFKDLNNEKWLRDFELEITNTSDKPIYLLELWVIVPEVISENGTRVGFPLRYGRADFIQFETVATPDDIPIKPGEKYVYRIAENYLQGWEAHKGREYRQQPRKIQIQLVQLSFGDGTGFQRRDGKPSSRQ